MLSTLKDLKYQKKRLLGVDWGERNVGLSISDILWVIASPLKVLNRKNDKNILTEISALLEPYAIGGMILGNPIHMSGVIGERSQRATQLVPFFEQHLQIPVFLWDERLSSSWGWKTFEGSSLSYTKKTKLIDKVAAGFILQGVLDWVRLNNHFE